MLKIILNIIFPKFCVNCSKIENYICSSCLQKYVKFNWQQHCHVCGKEIFLGMVHSECKQYSFLDGLLFLSMYDGIIKEIIHDVKYNFNYDQFNFLGEIMGNFLKFYRIEKEFLLVPIPVTKQRRRFRGFNQTEILARNISIKSKLRISNQLIKTKITNKQVGSDKLERESNLKDSFHIKGSYLIGKKFIIIDDVFTTGSTMNECAKILKEKGAEKVIGFVIAKSGL